MSEPFIGQIRMFAGTFAPRGHALCDGQLLEINQNEALFSLLGTTYGGDGRTTFGLPELRGRVPLGRGQGPGLSNYNIGNRAGSETATVNQANQLPSHTHPAQGANAADSAAPTGGRFAVAASEHYAPDGGNPLNTMNTGMIGTNSPSGQSHANTAPSRVINFIIALNGIFPSRD
jgi:microcystin-dependent protein